MFFWGRKVQRQTMRVFRVDLTLTHDVSVALQFKSGISWETMGNLHGILLDTAGSAFSKIIPESIREFTMIFSITVAEILIRKSFVFVPGVGNPDFKDFFFKCIKAVEENMPTPTDRGFIKIHYTHLNEQADIPSMKAFNQISGDPNAAPDPEKNPLTSDKLGFAFHMLTITNEERALLFWDYVTNPGSNLGRWNPTAFLVAFIIFGHYQAIYYAKLSRPDEMWPKAEERFALARDMLQPPRYVASSGIIYELGNATYSIEREWNTHKWVKEESYRAWDAYRGDLFWAMNNYRDPQAELEDEDRKIARRYITLLDTALRHETDAYTGFFYRGSSAYSWPETAIDTGSRFTSVTTDLATAVLFALGLGTKMGHRIKPRKTDRDTPNIGGLHVVIVKSPTPMVAGNLHEKEFILPLHCRLRFDSYKAIRIESNILFGMQLDAAASELIRRYPTFVFLTRFYHVFGLIEKGHKKSRVEACISCAQPATHMCSGCEKAHYCSDPQCASHIESHLDWCAEKK